MKHNNNHKRLKTNTLNCGSTEGLHAWIRFTITGFNIQWAIQQFRRGFRYQIAYSTEYALPKVTPEIKKQFYVYKKKIINRGEMHFHYIQGQYFVWLSASCWQTGKWSVKCCENNFKFQKACFKWRISLCKHMCVLKPQKAYLLKIKVESKRIMFMLRLLIFSFRKKVQSAYSWSTSFTLSKIQDCNPNSTPE